MKENLDLNQILFDELVEFPRKRLGISIREFCAPPTAKRKKKSINPQSLTRLVQELCVEMDEPEFMGYGAGALKEVYRAMRRGMEK